QLWGNWILRVRETGAAVGTVQATLPASGPVALPASGPVALPASGPVAASGRPGLAEVAWVVVSSAQGRGYAKEAAKSLTDRLIEDGWSVTAFIHPEHVASQRVARAAGMTATDVIRDGEQCWWRHG